MGGGVVGGGVVGGGVGLGGFFLPLPCPGGVAVGGETDGLGVVVGPTEGAGDMGGAVGVTRGVAVGGGLTDGAGVGFLAWAVKPMHKNAVAPAMIQIVRLIPTNPPQLERSAAIPEKS